jgi:hypothetical protein
MTLPDAIQILKLHNEWRKGADTELPQEGNENYMGWIETI